MSEFVNVRVGVACSIGVAWPSGVKIESVEVEHTLVESYAEKNHGRFFIAVLLTTLLCSR